MTRMTWTMIRDALAEDIRTGVLSAGAQLPTEPNLVERFGAGRQSVRKAIEALAREGQVSIEQGRGTFVEATPRLTYAIGKRTRLRRNLVPQGCNVSSELLGGDLIEPPETVRRALLLGHGDMVTVNRRLTLADGLPVAFGAAYHPAHRFPDFVERRDLLGSTTEAYKTYGVQDYLRKETEMHARRASRDEAKQLKQHPDVPVLVVRSIDAEPDGTPLSYAEVIWSAARVTFTMSNDDV